LFQYLLNDINVAFGRLSWKNLRGLQMFSIGRHACIVFGYVLKTL